VFNVLIMLWYLNIYLTGPCASLLQGLCSSLMFHLGKIGAYREAFSVYNMLKYSKRTVCKSLHEKILHILVRGRLLKDAYVVVKVSRFFKAIPF
jgi:hypothetical protein